MFTKFNPGTATQLKQIHNKGIAVKDKLYYERTFKGELLTYRGNHEGRLVLIRDLVIVEDNLSDNIEKVDEHTDTFEQYNITKIVKFMDNALHITGAGGPVIRDSYSLPPQNKALEIEVDVNVYTEEVTSTYDLIVAETFDEEQECFFEVDDKDDIMLITEETWLLI